MEIEITLSEGSAESRSQNLSSVLKNEELHYYNEIDIKFDQEQAGLISNHLDAIKINIITKI